MLNFRGGGHHLLAQFKEQLVFEGHRFIFRADDFAFDFLQLRGDEALAIDHRLLADVIGRHAREIGLGDFDEVAEHLVEANFQGADAGALDFLRLKGRNPLFAVVGGGAKLIQLFMIALADEAAFLDGDGWLIHQGSLNERDEVILRNDGAIQFREAAGGVRGQRGLQGGQFGERKRERADVASVA